jgi:hypothetical protein
MGNKTYFSFVVNLINVDVVKSAQDAAMLVLVY